jgi:hypothetical protein
MVLNLEVMVSIIGALATIAAVVTSVFMVSKQLKQVDRSIRANTYHSIIGNVLEYDRLVMSRPELAKIWEPSAYYRPQDDESTTRQRYACFLVLDFYEDHFYQYVQKTITPDMWKAWKSRLIYDLGNKESMLHDVWKEVEGLYFKDFIKNINNELSKPTEV